MRAFALGLVMMTAVVVIVLSINPITCAVSCA